jgi:outer membrane protein
MRILLILTATAMFATTTAIQAHEAGDFIVRGGIANVSPDASSSALILDGSAIGQSEADVDDNTQLGFTFTYMLTNNWAIDVLASTPFTHDISAFTGDLGLGTVDAGETTHLPPTVSLLFFPAASNSNFQPYFGAGINYTLFFDEDVASELESVLGRGSLELDASVGLALQAGFDYKLTDNMYFNAGIWWADIDTDAEFEFASNRITTDVEIDPFVYMLGLGWKF